jgi:hypothetical protein
LRESLLGCGDLRNSCFIVAYAPSAKGQTTGELGSAFPTAPGRAEIRPLPGSPWENGHCDSFNSQLRDELLNGEIFYPMKELRMLAERWRVHFNSIRPYSSLGYRSPAPEAWLTNTKGHGEVGTPTRFLFPHSLEDGYLNSK